MCPVFFRNHHHCLQQRKGILLPLPRMINRDIRTRLQLLHSPQLPVRNRVEKEKPKRSTRRRKARKARHQTPRISQVPPLLIQIVTPLWRITRVWVRKFPGSPCGCTRGGPIPIVSPLMGPWNGKGGHWWKM